MAKPKMSTLVEELLNDNIHVYTNEPEKEVSEIGNLEGVSTAFIVLGNPIHVKVDPRYSQAEIAQEIRDLLIAEIPDVFRE